MHEWDAAEEEWDSTPLEDRRTVWFGWLPILGLDGLNNNAVLKAHTWGLDLAGQFGAVNSLESAGGIGGLLATLDTQGTATTGDDKGYTFFYDGNGNVTQLLDRANWSIAAKYEYDPFSNVTASSGPMPRTTRSASARSSSTPETGLGYWGYRYYSPRLGRRMGRDPAEEYPDRHLYRYAANSPAWIVDDLGEEAKIVGAERSGAGTLYCIAAYGWFGTEKGHLYYWLDDNCKTPIDVLNNQIAICDEMFCGGPFRAVGDWFSGVGGGIQNTCVGAWTVVLDPQKTCDNIESAFQANSDRFAESGCSVDASMWKTLAAGLAVVIGVEAGYDTYEGADRYGNQLRATDYGERCFQLGLTVAPLVGRAITAIGNTIRRMFGSRIPAHLRAGVAAEAARLKELGLEKNTTVWRPCEADIASAAFKVIVGKAVHHRWDSKGHDIGLIDEWSTGNQVGAIFPVLDISNATAGLLQSATSYPYDAPYDQANQSQVSCVAGALGGCHCGGSMTQNAEMPNFRFRHTKHQVARGARPDAEVNNKLYLLKRTSEMRATYQVRLLSYLAHLQAKKLIIEVPHHCKVCSDLRDLVRISAGVVQVVRS